MRNYIFTVRNAVIVFNCCIHVSENCFGVHSVLFTRSLEGTKSRHIFLIACMKNRPTTNSANTGHLCEYNHTLTKHTRTHTWYIHAQMWIWLFTHTHLTVSTPENSALFLFSSFSSLLPLLSLAPSGDDSLGCQAAPLSSVGSVFLSCSFEVLI